MGLTTAFLVITAIYVWFLCIDRFLKSCSHYAYIQFLNGTGLEINFLQLRWTTTALNRLLVRLGSGRSKFLNVWFNIGLFASLALFPVALYVFLIAFIQNFSSGMISESLIIEPALPGVNLPVSEIGYYSLTLLISSVLHELGHALSAVLEDVNLINVGANLTFVLPVAFVNINSDKLFSLSPWKRLKILCAGVWHNLFIALGTYLLYISLPIVFSLFYHHSQGVSVSHIATTSPVTGTKGLNLGNTIISINDCHVRTEDSWYNCLAASHVNKPSFCIEADLVHNLDESVNLHHSESGVVNCCHAENRGRLCFEYLDVADSILEFPPYVCLPGRQVIEVSKGFCSTHPHTCPKDTFCFKPILSNHTNLYKIGRIDHADVIFVGPLSDLLRTITVSSYVPKYPMLTTTVPDVITKFLGYMVVFSMGLAIVNILPCVFFDGQYITNTLFHILLSSRLRTTHIKVISGVVTVSVSVLLGIHCFVTIYKKIYA